MDHGGTGGYTEFASLIALSFSMVGKGFFDHALQIADAVVESAERGRTWGGSGWLIAAWSWRCCSGNWSSKSRARLTHTGTSRRGGRRAVWRMTVIQLGQRANPPTSNPGRPWLGSRLLWWPRGEFDRIVGRVPELRRVLGNSWREHTSTVESAMTAARPRAVGHGGAA